MCIPSRREFDDYVHYHYNWRAMDRALYDLCRPEWSHDIHLYDRILSSVLAVGLAYRALIHRENALEQIAEALFRRANPTVASWPLADMGPLPLGPDPTMEGIQQSVMVHGVLCQHLSEYLPEELGVRRSFVAKWLHFHRPGVPLYDQYAEKALNGFNLHVEDQIQVPDRAHVDEQYRNFCQRLWAFAQLLGYPPPSVRELDVYLWFQGRQIV